MSLKPPLLRSRYICPYCAHTSPLRPRRTLSSHANKADTNLPLSRLNSYTTTLPPKKFQLKYANNYFTTEGEAQFLFSAAHFREFPYDSTAPEVTFLGRSNVGKSSLLNALFGVNDRGRGNGNGKEKKAKVLAFVSKKPGRTQCMNVYGIGGSTEGGGVRREVKAGLSKELLSKATADKDRKPTDGLKIRNVIGSGGLCVVDMPGYGFASREAWGKEIMKYLQGRRQLRRAFVLIDASVGITKGDEQILDLLRASGTPHQIILSKIDKFVDLPGFTRVPVSPTQVENAYRKLQELFKSVRERISPPGSGGGIVLGDILATSSAKKLAGGELAGIDGLRWAVLQAVGLQCDDNGRRRTVNVDVVAEPSEEPVMEMDRWSPKRSSAPPSGLESLLQAEHHLRSSRLRATR